MYKQSVQFSRSVVSNSLRPHESQHTRPPCPSPTPKVHSNSRPSSQWCHPAISSSVVPFSSCPNPSQHQGLFQWVNSSHQVDKVLEFQLQHQSDRKSTRLNSSHRCTSRMPSSAFPASGSFPMSQFFSSDGQSIGVPASTSVLPMNIPDWFPLGWTGWISLQSKGLSRVFSNTTVQKHQFSSTQLFSQCNSHIHTLSLEKPQHWLDGPLLAKEYLCFLISCLGWS